MPPFKVRFYWHELTGYSATGGPAYRRHSLPMQLAVVALNVAAVKTAVRTDASGSHQYAKEWQSTSKVLLPATSPVKVNDKLDIDGLLIKVVKITPRYTVWGELDHLEMEADYAGQG